MHGRIGGALICLTLIGLFCAACGRAPAPPPPVLEYPGVSRVNPPGWPALSDFAWSPDGSKIAATNQVGGEMTPESKIYILDVATGQLDLFLEAHNVSRAVQSWSPDGEKIAFSETGGPRSGIWVVDADGSGEPQFLSDGFSAAWSPNGEELAIYGIPRDSESNLWTKSIWILDLRTGDRRIVFSRSDERNMGLGLSWSPDGANLAFDFGAGQTGQSIENNVYILDLTTGDLHQLTHSGHNVNPTWSPDGRLIAYVGEPDFTLTISRADDDCSVQPLSTTFVGDLEWSPDGNRITFTWNGGIYLMDIAAVLGEDFLETGPVCP